MLQFPAMDDPAVAALVELLRREGGEGVVGAVINANLKSLYQIASRRLLPSGKPKGVGRTLREKLERHYPGWLHLAGHAATDTASSYAGITARPATHQSTGESNHYKLTGTRIAPPRIGWEALAMLDLPGEFETALPDNAMAPEAHRGARCIFITGADPEPGDWVLVRDRHGQLHCREYRVTMPGQWEAHAVNRAYLPLHSQTDELTILAVFDGMRGRKSAR